MIKNRSDEIRFWAQRYFENRLGVVLFHYRSKIPIRAPITRSWWRIGSDRELAAALRAHPRVNLALDLKDSDALGVEWDSPEGAVYAGSLGVRSRSKCWIGKSARGYRVIYRRPRGFNLPSYGRIDYPIEFKSTTLLLVCPSVHPTGVVYSWSTGHSAIEHALSDLEEPPPQMLAEWKALSSTPKHRKVPGQYAKLNAGTRAELATLVLEVLPNAHFVDREHRQIAGFTDPNSRSKSHVWVDLEKGCYIDWHDGKGGTIAELLTRLGCHGIPRVYSRRNRVIMEVSL